jgi:L-lysine exporter family protein LysE/ArgO
MSFLYIFLIALVAAFIGALPLGLVNVSVLQAAYQKSIRNSIYIALGATIVEVIYGIIGITIGSILSQIVSQNKWILWVVFAIPALVGILFFLKKPNKVISSSRIGNGFLQGFILNIVSVQVLIYWIIAITYISAQWSVHFNPITFMLLITGIATGKMLVLAGYAYWGQLALKKSGFVMNNINRITGSVIFLMSIIQIARNGF